MALVQLFLLSPLFAKNSQNFVLICRLKVGTKKLIRQKKKNRNREVVLSKRKNATKCFSLIYMGKVVRL